MKQISRQRKYQLRHMEQGLCMKCAKPAVCSGYCEEHRVSHNAIKRNRYRKAHNTSVDKPVVWTHYENDEERLEARRKRGRVRSRIKAGIPLDAPLHSRAKPRKSL